MLLGCLALGKGLHREEYFGTCILGNSKIVSREFTPPSWASYRRKAFPRAPTPLFCSQISFHSISVKCHDEAASQLNHMQPKSVRNYPLFCLSPHLLVHDNLVLGQTTILRFRVSYNTTNYNWVALFFKKSECCN